MRYDVTIGMPVFQSEAYIRRALESALAQTYPSVEILIVDDKGDDGSMDIVRQLQTHHPRGASIRLLSHRQNMGVSASRNQIIDEARGEYLYFMDSDDVIADGAVELLMRHARQSDAEVVFGSYEKILTTGQREVYQYPFLQLQEPDQLASFAYRRYAGIQASACNYLVKTALLREHRHRFIDTDFWEDMVFTFDLVTLVSRAVLLPDITYTYCCREHSLSNYQSRPTIGKDEIMRNVRAIEHLKTTSAILYNKVYFPRRCSCIAMTDFYIVCNILKRRSGIVPPVTLREMRLMMVHPASLRQICTFRQSRLKNLALYLLGRLPSFLCVALVWMGGKSKKLI